MQMEISRNTGAEILVTHQGQKWTNWRRQSGQTGGAAKSALATTWSDLGKFWGCLWPPDMLQNPKMYDTWGCASHFFSARSLWSKITRSQGIRSPDPLPKWVGEPDYRSTGTHKLSFHWKKQREIELMKAQHVSRGMRRSFWLVNPMGVVWEFVFH